MKSIKYLILSNMIFLNMFFLTGCWNYREVEKLAVVAGVAIDKGKNNQFIVTTEVIQISGGRESKTTSTYITMEGKSIFDAVRNQISFAGKKLYWSHTKVVIVSKEIARHNMLSVIDWYNRDSETRSDVNLLVSREKTAKKVLEQRALLEDINSFELADTLKNQISLSKAPIKELWGFINDLEAQGIVNIVPAVHLKKNKNMYSPQIMGAAVFDNAKLIGFLNSEETQEVLFVKDEVKGGLLIDRDKTNGLKAPISMEIFKNKTKIEPVVSRNNEIKFNIKVDTRVDIDEIVGNVKYANEKVLKKLSNNEAKNLKNRIEHCIKKVQSEYGVDIFGFGAKLREDNPKVWKKVASSWNDRFKNVSVNVSTKVNIKGSGLFSEPIKMGD
ncbi:MAG: Ger(x)C family spore germination protein [Bacillota bacterium]|nr:Ger(x)C family spore germination protein [Bacillota bacterium]